MKQLLLAVVIIAGTLACKNSDSGERVAYATKINKLFDEISKSTSAGQDIERSKSFVTLCKDYATKWPQDTMSAQYLFYAASETKNLGNFKEAVDILDNLTKNYPNFSRGSEAQFFKCFLTLNSLGDITGAKSCFQAFLDKYKSDPLRKDAQFMLDNINLNGEQMLEKIKKQNEHSH